jgi:hypothetical protein
MPKPSGEVVISKPEVFELASFDPIACMFAASQRLRALGCPIGYRKGKLAPLDGFELEAELQPLTNCLVVRWSSLPRGQGR